LEVFSENLSRGIFSLAIAKNHEVKAYFGLEQLEKFLSCLKIIEKNPVLAKQCKIEKIELLVLEIRKDYSKGVGSAISQ